MSCLLLQSQQEISSLSEEFIPNIIDDCGAIIMTPYNSESWGEHDNYNISRRDHPKCEIECLVNVIKDVAPKDYITAFDEYAKDNLFYACNLFVMKKDDFLEMCDICFSILDEYDKRQKYTDNNDVFYKIVKLSHKQHLMFGVNWQVRLQGFLLEYLTDTYYRYKFGVDNCYKANIGIKLNRI